MTFVNLVRAVLRIAALTIATALLGGCAQAQTGDPRHCTMDGNDRIADIGSGLQRHSPNATGRARADEICRNYRPGQISQVPARDSAGHLNCSDELGRWRPSCDPQIPAPAAQSRRVEGGWVPVGYVTLQDCFNRGGRPGDLGQGLQCHWPGTWQFDAVTRNQGLAWQALPQTVRTQAVVQARQGCSYENLISLGAILSSNDRAGGAGAGLLAGFICNVFAKIAP